MLNLQFWRHFAELAVLAPFSIHQIILLLLTIVMCMLTLSHKMVKHTQTICRQQPTNCLSVFDHFVNLTLKGLKDNYVQITERLCISFIVTRSILSVLPLWLCSILITLSGDVETNPGPKRNSTETFSFCHWNLNSISSHNYVKMFLVKVYITVHKFDIICFS